MRIVVTGGKGFIGRAVVDRLLESRKPDDVIAVTTREPEGSDPWGGRVEQVQAFAGDAVSLGRAFSGADVVVHTIQFPNHPVENPSKGYTYEELDGRGTQLAARTARKLGVRRFVYLSGAGAGQGRPERWFQAKDRAEAAIRETGMEHALLRPSWIYGPGDRSMSRFVAFCRYLPLVPVIGDGKTAVYPIYVKDVARCVADAVRREDAKELVFELGGPKRLSMDAIIGALQGVLGTRRPLLHHPAGLMKLLVLPLQLLSEPILSPGAIDFVLQEVDLDPQPAMDHFGFRFRSLEEGLKDYLP
jgi:NADH dehydrogenase